MFLHLIPSGIVVSIIYIGSIVSGGAMYIPVVLSIVCIYLYFFLAVFSLHRRFQLNSAYQTLWGKRSLECCVLNFTVFGDI